MRCYHTIVHKGGKGRGNESPYTLPRLSLDALQDEGALKVRAAREVNGKADFGESDLCCNVPDPSGTGIFLERDCLLSWQGDAHDRTSEGALFRLGPCWRKAEWWKDVHV